MKKNKTFSILLIFVFVLMTNIKIYSADYTFCYGSISLSLFDGGATTQIRYGEGGVVLKSISGEWTAYGSPTDIPGQLIKIKFNVSTETFSYTMIRDGYGNPAALIDGQGRRYNLCDKSKKESSPPSLSNIIDKYAESKRERYDSYKDDKIRIISLIDKNYILVSNNQNDLDIIDKSLNEIEQSSNFEDVKEILPTQTLSKYKEIVDFYKVFRPHLDTKQDIYSYLKNKKFYNKDNRYYEFNSEGNRITTCNYYISSVNMKNRYSAEIMCGLGQFIFDLDVKNNLISVNKNNVIETYYFKSEEDKNKKWLIDINPLKKYEGIYISTHPLVKEIEFYNENKKLYMKMKKTSTDEILICNEVKSDTLYFTDPQNDNPNYYNTFGKTYKYHFVFSKKENENFKNVKIIFNGGQIINAIKKEN